MVLPQPSYRRTTSPKAVELETRVWRTNLAEDPEAQTHEKPASCIIATVLGLVGRALGENTARQLLLASVLQYASPQPPRRPRTADHRLRASYWLLTLFSHNVTLLHSAEHR